MRLGLVGGDRGGAEGGGLGGGGVAAHAEEAEAAERVGGEDAESERAEDGAEEHEEVDGVLHGAARLLNLRLARAEMGGGPEAQF